VLGHVADASKIVKRHRAKTRQQRLEPCLILRLPVWISVAMVRHGRPFHHNNGRHLDALLWPYRRASLIAASFASQPELQKNALSMPDSTQPIASFPGAVCDTGWTNESAWRLISNGFHQLGMACPSHSPPPGNRSR